MIFRQKPETVVTTKVYVDEKLISEGAKVIKDDIDWLKWGIALTVALTGIWAMVLDGVFRVYG